MDEAVTAGIRQSGQKPNRRIEVWKASQARDLTSDIMSVEMAPEVIERLAHYQNSGIEDGYVVKVLFCDELSGVSLTYAWFKANYRLSPHSHNTDCTYYVISGEAHLGAKSLRAGDVFFVPADVSYAYAAGPDGVEVLEFRAATKFNVRFATSTESVMKRTFDVVTNNRSDWLVQEPPEAARRILSSAA